MYVELNSLKEQEQDFQFFDVSGKEVKTEKRALQKGIQRLDFDCSALLHDVYQIVATGSYTKNLPTRFVKL